MSESTHALARQRIVRLRLTPAQADQLVPLVAGANENVLFISVVVPFWSPDEAKTIWELQVVKVPAKIGPRIMKLIRTEGGEPK